MKKFIIHVTGIVFLLCSGILFIGNAYGAVIHSNFGPSDSYNDTFNSSVNSSQWIAAEFVVSSPGYSTISVDVAVSATESGTLTVSVYSDNGGLPGSVLTNGTTTINVTTQAIYTANLPSLVLNPGTYHVVLSHGTATGGRWYDNDQGAKGFSYSTDQGSSWSSLSASTTSAFRVNADVSLAVGLSSFSAVQQGSSIQLNWTTESETNNTGFILERKSDASWLTIASYITDDALKCQGNTSSETDYTFTDSDVVAGETYSYRLSDVDFEGTITIKDVLSVTLDEIPEWTDLLPATPNPFNPSTKIQYTLAENADVTLRVVNMNGQTVQTIYSGQNQTAGSYSVHWNGQNDSGLNASSGIYLLVLNAGQIVKSQKVMLVR